MCTNNSQYKFRSFDQSFVAETSDGYLFMEKILPRRFKRPRDLFIAENVQRATRWKGTLTRRALWSVSNYINRQPQNRIFFSVQPPDKFLCTFL